MKLKLMIMIATMSFFALTPALAQSCQCASPLTVSASCSGGANNVGWASATVSGGVPPYSYVWTASGGVITDGKYTNNAQVEGAGFVGVSVTVTDSCGTSKTNGCGITMGFGGGGGGPYPLIDSEIPAPGMTVLETLSLLEYIKDGNFTVAFDGVSFLDAMANDQLMRMHVINIIDDEDKFTLVLEGTTEKPFNRNQEARDQ